MAENSPPTEEKKLSPAEKAKLAAAKKAEAAKKAGPVGDPLVDNGDGTTTQEVHIFSFGNEIRGPGCQPWTASGEMSIWHDLTRDARTVVRAAQAYGNPYDE